MPLLSFTFSADEPTKSPDKRRKGDEVNNQRTHSESPAKMLEDLFRKTKATPYIYWLPLTDEQVVEKEKLKERLEKERQERIANRRPDAVGRKRSDSPPVQRDTVSREERSGSLLTDLSPVCSCATDHPSSRPDHPAVPFTGARPILRRHRPDDATLVLTLALRHGALHREEDKVILMSLYYLSPISLKYPPHPSVHYHTTTPPILLTSPSTPFSITLS